jgi:membrane-associated phospholipid phosphatase
LSGDGAPSRPEPRTRTWRRAELFFLAAAILSAVFLLLLRAEYHDDSQIRLDLWGERSIRGAVSPDRSGAIRAVSVLGAWFFLLPASLLVGGILWKKRMPRRLAAFAVSVAGAEVIVEIVKFVVRRPRPESLEPLAQAVGFSFPSGHSAVSAAFFGSVASILAISSGSRWRSAAWLAGGAAVVGAVGVSRVALGVHWATDVLAGWTLGFGWLALVVGVAAARERTILGTRRDDGT